MGTDLLFTENCLLGPIFLSREANTIEVRIGSVCVCGRDLGATIGRAFMPAFSPALITIMRTVLEEAMTNVPVEQATTATKAYLAEFILKAAAGGLTSYEGLIAAAVSQLPTILSMLT